MAGELQVSGSFTFSKNGIAAFARAVTGLLVNVAGNGGIYDPGLVTGADTAIPLAGILPRWAYFHNLDTANSITIRAAVAGQKICTLQPGEFGFWPLDPAITAPSSLASAGSPLLEYALWPA